MPKKSSTTEDGEFAPLIDAGLPRAVVERIRAVGLTSLRQLVLYNPEELAEILGYQDVAVAEKVIAVARRALGMDTQPLTARERLERVGSVPVVKTDIKEFDNLIGGLRFGASYEFAGEFGSGKTIMALQVSVASVAQHGVGVVYIDTEKTLDSYLGSELLKNMCTRFGVNYDEFLDKHLLTYNPATVDELEEFIRVRVSGLVTGGSARVIIVDSVTALYRAQFRGRERLAERQQRLHYVLDWLRRLTIREGVLVIYTNQVMTMPTGYIELKMPVGGNVLAHTVNQRWLMQKPKSKNEGVIKALDVPGVPSGAEAKFTIENDGLH
ncbi:ATPase domain-containing protein [Vulcanisaeta thermophila]|uniref:ATPase domain-containing protein n=1 Tax=Vulcanisaeta thermophila TaxID=867917 RepID=UPI000A011689|nr:ATPase domain-containing protein [Vulcanisaeta thermophila]